MVDIFDLDTLMAQLVTALGAALVAGNGFAMWMDFRGRMPKHAKGPFRRGRAWFLTVVGAVMTVWGAVSLLA